MRSQNSTAQSGVNLGLFAKIFPGQLDRVMRAIHFGSLARLEAPHSRSPSPFSLDRFTQNAIIVKYLNYFTP